MGEQSRGTANAGSSFGCIGSIVASVLSMALNHSGWWALFHFVCSWTYILYALLFRSSEILPALRAMFGG